MRLTLRSMLAYLDDILEPNDVAEIREKVKESEFATGLVHRIRGSVRRLRLSAPKLKGTGLGLNANSVAEYLDNNLEAEKVPDFEKVCLESDVHLAEVASCHQVLTLVLGEPAEVAPETRQRMYRIQPVEEQDRSKTLLETSTASNTPPPKQVVNSDTPFDAPRLSQRKREAPDYLREKSRIRWAPLAATIVLATFVTLLGLRALGEFDAAHPILGFVFLNTVDQQVNQRSVTMESGMNTPNGSALHLAQPSEGTVETRTAPEVSSPTSTSLHQPLDEPSENHVSRDTPLEIDEIGALPVGFSNNPSLVGSANPPKNLGETLGNEDPDPVNPAQSVSTESEELANGDTEQVPLELLPVNGPTTSEQEETPSNDPTDLITGTNLGKLTTPKDILARWDEVQGVWIRLAAESGISLNDRVIALPTYQPQLQLNTGAILTIDGGSSLDFPSGGPAGFVISLQYGRLLLQNNDNGHEISLRLGNREGNIRFEGEESAVSVEVANVHYPGTDPLDHPASTIVRLQPLQASVAWIETGLAPVTLQSGQQLELINQSMGATKAVDQSPAWLEPNNIHGILKTASIDLETQIDTEQSLSLLLSELAHDRRHEIGALALLGLCHTGELDSFDSMIDAFNNERHKLWWNEYFNAITGALARNAETSENVLLSLQKKRGQDAQELLRLLQRYSPQQLQDGAATQLVEYLDHEKLIYRVLSFQNLKFVTGKTLSFAPQHRHVRRRPSVQNWRKRLQAGKIAYQQPPTDYRQQTAE